MTKLPKFLEDSPFTKRMRERKRKIRTFSRFLFKYGWKRYYKELENGEREPWKEGE